MGLGQKFVHLAGGMDRGRGGGRVSGVRIRASARIKAGAVVRVSVRVRVRVVCWIKVGVKVRFKVVVQGRAFGAVPAFERQ